MKNLIKLNTSNSLKPKPVFHKTSTKLFNKLISYSSSHEHSINPTTRESYWKKQAEELAWIKFPNTILDSSKAPFYRWYSDGKINMSYNCLDRHLSNSLSDSPALISESAYSSDEAQTLTYKQLHSEVCKLSTVLIEKYKLTKGDRVIIFMPNIPESVISMLACARLGLIHSVVFGGFAAEELALRIRDCKPKLIITASVGIEPKKQIPYYPIVKEALEIQKSLGEVPILIYQREKFYIEKNLSIKDNYSIYQEEIDKVRLSTYYEDNLISTDPLYILYTSGTTGAPKGICRDIGGTSVGLNLTMKSIMDIHPKDVVFTTSDIGWAVGHSFITYGPLLRGAATVLYEGKPIGTPHCGKFWELIVKHNVKALYTSPTAMRAVKKEDPHGTVFKSYDLSCLKSIHLAGERCDTSTISWLQDVIGKDKMINDNWWQTETGWPMSSNLSLPHSFPLIPGSSSKPVYGYDIKIVDDENDAEVTKPNITGKIYVRFPLPPSFMLSLWGNDEAFKDKYVSKDGTFYITGDAGHFDENGYLFIEARVDDVINVAGHRLSTGRIEEVLTQVKGIVEAAVVSVKDQVKGEIPFAFIICDSQADLSSEIKINEMKEKAKKQVATHIGAISRLKDVVIVSRLPKTRSGKILRGVLKKIINNDSYKLPSTIDDSTVIDEIINQLKKEKFIL